MVSTYWLSIRTIKADSLLVPKEQILSRWVLHRCSSIRREKHIKLVNSWLEVECAYPISVHFLLHHPQRQDSKTNLQYSYEQNQHCSITGVMAKRLTIRDRVHSRGHRYSFHCSVSSTACDPTQRMSQSSTCRQTHLERSPAPSQSPQAHDKYTLVTNVNDLIMIHSVSQAVTVQTYFLPPQVVSFTTFAAVASDAEAITSEESDENSIAPGE